MHYDADVQRPRRRQGRDRRAVDRGRPLRPAHPGLRRRRRCWPTARCSTRTGPRSRSSSTRSTPASTTSPSRSARPAPTRTARCPTCSRPPPPTSAARARRSTRPSRTSASSARPSTTTRRSSSARPASSRASSARWPTNDKTVRRFNESLADVSGDARPASGRSSSASLRNLATALGQVSTLRQGEPELARPQHLRAQPGLEGAGQARGELDEILDSRRWRSTTWR